MINRQNHQLSTLEKYWNKMKTEKDKIKMKEAIMQIHIPEESHT